MTTWTKRLLQGAGVCFLVLVVLQVGGWILDGDRETSNTQWMIGTLLEIATVGLLLGAGISFLVGRVAKKA